MMATSTSEPVQLNGTLIDNRFIVPNVEAVGRGPKVLANGKGDVSGILDGDELAHAQVATYTNDVSITQDLGFDNIENTIEAFSTAVHSLSSPPVLTLVRIWLLHHNPRLTHS